MIIWKFYWIWVLMCYMLISILFIVSWLAVFQCNTIIKIWLQVSEVILFLPSPSQSIFWCLCFRSFLFHLRGFSIRNFYPFFVTLKSHLWLLMKPTVFLNGESELFKFNFFCLAFATVIFFPFSFVYFKCLFRMVSTITSILVGHTIFGLHICGLKHYCCGINWRLNAYLQWQQQQLLKHCLMWCTHWIFHQLILSK